MAREIKVNNDHLANNKVNLILQELQQYWRGCLNFIDEPLIVIEENDYRVHFINQAAINFLGLSQDVTRLIHVDDCIAIRNCTTQQPLLISDALNQGVDALFEINKIAELLPNKGRSTSINFKISEKEQIPGYLLISLSIPGQQNPAVIEISEPTSLDELTGLETRGAFERDLQLALKLCLSGEQHHVAGKIKVAHLNTINELCGSVAGDELLRQLTEIIQDEFVQSGELYRLTGSEFGFLFDNLEMDTAVTLAEQVLASIRGHEFEWDNKPLPVSVNMGLTSITKVTDNWLSLMGEMDAACQAAASEADNYYKIFSTEDKQISQNHSEMGLISTIISALQNDRLVLHVQKIVPISKNNNVPHIEMLIRMYDENDELLAPGLFLGAAETYNLILMIDKWVIKNTLKWLEDNQNWLDPNLVCNINLSGFSIGQKSFKDFLLKSIKQSTINAHQLCFEITETAAVKDFGKANAFIQAVKETGAIFALDDFGSGMSSFAYLKNLKVDIIKIDGTLIRQLDLDSFDKVMVQSICQIARVMGLSTVAEFVENEAILKQLEFLGVDYAQGFHLCKPMPLEEYQQLESSSE